MTPATVRGIAIRKWNWCWCFKAKAIASSATIFAPCNPGDLVLLGPSLPHAYQHKDRLSARQPPAHCVLLQFEERLWCGVLELPAMASVRRLLARAANGLHVTDPTRRQVAAMLLEMLKLRGPRRIAAFLAVLDALAQSRSCKTIASPGFTASLSSYGQGGSDGFANSSMRTIIVRCGLARLPSAPT